MSSSTSKLFALMVGVAFAAGCSHPPPPKAPDPPEEVEETPPPPPPKPKCEALDEKCSAKDDTRAKIAKTDLALTPPSGWTYAQTDAATVAQVDDGGATVAATGFEADPKEAGNAKKLADDRQAAFESLAKAIGVTPPKAKVNWKKKPDDVKKVAGLSVALWQLDGGARGDKKGPLLVFAADIADGKELIGIGFVPADDESGSDEAILKAIDSIGAKDDK
jgi:hypothetical protein